MNAICCASVCDLFPEIYQNTWLEDKAIEHLGRQKSHIHESVLEYTNIHIVLRCLEVPWSPQSNLLSTSKFVLGSKLSKPVYYCDILVFLILYCNHFTSSPGDGWWMCLSLTSCVTWWHTNIGLTGSWASGFSQRPRGVFTRLPPAGSEILWFQQVLELDDSRPSQNVQKVTSNIQKPEDT